MYFQTSRNFWSNEHIFHRGIIRYQGKNQLTSCWIYSLDTVAIRRDLISVVSDRYTSEFHRSIKVLRIACASFFVVDYLVKLYR